VSARSCLAFVAALACPSLGCAAGLPRALVIGIDGLRPDQLRLAHTPVLDALAADGTATGEARNAWTRERAWNGHGATNWGVLLTGVSPSVSKLTQNGDAQHRISDDAWLAAPPRLATHLPLDDWLVESFWYFSMTSIRVLLQAFRDPDPVPTMFGRLKAAHPGAETGCFSAWPGIALEPGTILGASRSGVDCFYSPRDADASAAERDRATADAAIEALAGQGRFAGAGAELVFVQLSQCDAAGHAGTDSRTSIESVDALVGEMLAAIRSRATRRGERWLVLVTTDHGGLDEAGEHADNADPRVHTIPLLIAADGVLPGKLDLRGASLYDVTPTVLDWLGVPAEGALPGRSRLRR
jgi:predicted AlkP superfamily pyrophosphatase or phosphodiesterase